MKKVLLLIGCFILYSTLGVYVTARTRDITNSYFAYNVMLSALPFLFAWLLARRVDKGKKSVPIIVLLTFLWFIFFPNAPYMATDFIHLTDDGRLDPVGFYTVFYWVKLLYFTFGVMFGLLLGCESMAIMHRLSIRRFGRGVSAVLLTITSLVGGFAVYIGRFLRLNSWDVFRPVRLFGELSAEMNAFTIYFTLLFAAFILGVYILYYLVSRRAEDRAAIQADGGTLDKKEAL